LDPLGNNSANKKYGIPPSNPFAGDNNPSTLGEIYAYGVRNPQRLFWDPKNRNMFMSDIGQNTVEEISPVTSGANLGWNIWEASFKFVAGRPGGVEMTDQRKDPKVTYPIVEYGQLDPLFQPNSAAIGGLVYRSTKVPQLTNLLLFGDNPSGEIFYVSADNLPKGGQDPIHRILLNENGASKTFLQIINDKKAAQGQPLAQRVDLRFCEGPDGQIFLLNKQDGIIRVLVP
jgi:glucose/arabinose dehydrogenase